MQSGMKYLTIILPMLISFVFSAVSGKLLIPYLLKLKVGQTERTDGVKSHLSKTGTPNMGGIMFLVGLAAASVCMAGACPEVIPVLILTVGFGLVGFIDDYLKVVKKKSDGLSVKQKMALQIVIALLFAFYITKVGGVPLSMKIPFLPGKFLDLRILNIPAFLFISVATVNGTNFTDGVDGLASCVTLAVALFFTIAAVFSGSGAAASGGAMIGGLLGFLIYNAQPAKVFMGDTGSLALGGFVTAMAYLLQLPLFIPIVGFIYFIEVVSVILQVGYFKKTHGKRIFRMAPIHHHFELGGWSEVKVVAVFTVVTTILSAIAILGLWN